MEAIQCWHSRWLSSRFRGAKLLLAAGVYKYIFARYNLIIDTSEMHTLNKLSRVFGTNVKTILCNNPNMTLKIQV